MTEAPAAPIMVGIDRGVSAIRGMAARSTGRLVEHATPQLSAPFLLGLAQVLRRSWPGAGGVDSG